MLTTRAIKLLRNITHSINNSSNITSKPFLGLMVQTLPRWTTKAMLTCTLIATMIIFQALTNISSLKWFLKAACLRVQITLWILREFKEVPESEIRWIVFVELVSKLQASVLKASQAGELEDWTTRLKVQETKFTTCHTRCSQRISQSLEAFIREQALSTIIQTYFL